MHSVRLVFLLLLYLAQQEQHLADCKGCNYSMLEEALVNDPSNLEQLQLAFFPTNKQKRIVFDVVYHLPKPDIERNSSVVTAVTAERIVVAQGGNEGGYIAHRVLRNADGDGDNGTDKADNSLTFRWMASPIIMYCRPDLLKNLSLFAFETDITTINLTIDACNYEQGKEKICSELELDQADIRRLLNELTTNLYSYALHQQSSSHFGVQSQDEKGYSAFFYTSSLPNGYCVFTQNRKYLNLRKYSCIALVLMIFFIMFIVPTIFVAIYERLYEKMKNSKRLQYFVWSVAIITFILSLIIAGFDIAVWAFNLEYYLKTPGTEDTLFIVYIVFLCVAIIGDIIAVGVGIYILHHTVSSTRTDHSKKWKEDFPIPSLIKCLSCMYFCCCTCSRNCKRHAMIWIGSTFFAFFLQLSSFHIFYMALAAVASPVETVSHIIFYLASFFCLVAIVAFILKFTDKSGCDELCRSFDRTIILTMLMDIRMIPTNCKQPCKKFLSNIVKFFPVVLSIFILSTSFVLFGLFYFLFSVMIENYRNNGGILAFVGVLVPSTLTALIGLIKTSLMGCIDVTKKEAEA